MWLKEEFILFMVSYLDNYIFASYFLLFCEMWGFPTKWCEKNPGNLRISRFYDITHEADHALVRFQKRAARLILDLECLTPLALLYNTLKLDDLSWKSSLSKSSTNVQNYTLWCSWLSYNTFYFYIWPPFTASSVFLNISFVHTQAKTWNIPPFIYIFRGFCLESSPC